MEREYVLPSQIEKRSFEIIKEELLSRNIVLPKEEEAVTMRVIHTTADFDYAKTMTYSENAVELARSLIKEGVTIVTDTTMALSGINKKRLGEYGGNVVCFIGDEDVAEYAKINNTTRSVASMRKARKLSGNVIFAIGNAPTALMAIKEMMDEDGFKPDLVIGVPVGFVNVEYAKELIVDSDIPFIINKGRKGGSNVAAAIVNALVYGIDNG